MGMTCQIPLHLAPEELSLIKNVVGQDPSLTVEWTHPKKKRPENGYYIVIAGFSDNTKTQLFTVSRDTTKFIFDGPDYDPFDDHSVTVIARQNEAKGHTNPQGTDFAIRKHTGLLKKSGAFLKEPDQRQYDVQPNACCSTKYYNTDDKQCCGEKLFSLEDQNLSCCGNVVYDRHKEICCGSGAIGEPKLESIHSENPCKLGKKLIGSSQMNLKQMTADSVVVRGSVDFEELKSNLGDTTFDEFSQI